MVTVRATKRMVVVLSAALFLRSATARAQEPTAQTCATPCAANERCVDGQCVVNPDAAPAPAAAPEPAAPERPAPPAHRRPHHPSAIEKEFGEDADETPSPPASTDEPAPVKRGLLFMPFLGIHIVQGIAADDYGAGGRLGFLLGTRLDRRVSLNVELAMDILSPNAPDRMTSVKGTDLTIAFSPLFHAGAGAVELVVGPKLGFWSDNLTQTIDSSNTKGSQSGWAYGANAGVFTAVNDSVEMGLLLAYQFTAAVQTCVRDTMTSMCSTSGAFPPEILSFSAAALF